MATREDTVRAAARKAVTKSDTLTARATIRESARVAKSNQHQSYDYFLSHSHQDAELVLGVKELIELLGYSVYIDWIDDPNQPGGEITEENAAKIRSAMSRCKNMAYIHTANASLSKWCPWELGYFDNKDPERIRIVYISRHSLETVGQEYLRLYKQWDLG